MVNSHIKNLALTYIDLFLKDKKQI